MCAGAAAEVGGGRLQADGVGRHGRKNERRPERRERVAARGLRLIRRNFVESEIEALLMVGFSEDEFADSGRESRRVGMNIVVAEVGNDEGVGSRAVGDGEEFFVGARLDGGDVDAADGDGSRSHGAVDAAGVGARRRLRRRGGREQEEKERKREPVHGA